MSKSFCILFLFFLLYFLPLCVLSQQEFKLQAEKLGLIEQTLLSQAIENDAEVKEIDTKLQKLGFTTSIGKLGSGSIKSSVRIIALSSNDSPVRFITNGINLGADTLGLLFTGYEMYKTKKLKNKLEKRIVEIRDSLLDVFTKIEASKDDADAKNTLISLVGEKATNEYLYWLQMPKNR